jgi:DNA repair photolyase
MVDYKSRYMVSTGEECPARCIYCLRNDPTASFDPHQNINDLGEKITNFLKNEIRNPIDITESIKEIYFGNYRQVTVGLEEEIFYNPQKGLQLLEYLSQFNRAIPIATKFALNEEYVKRISSLNQELKGRTNGSAQILIRYSFTSGYDNRKIEKGTSKIVDRINTMKLLKQYDIETSVMLRPILPKSIVSLDAIVPLLDDVSSFTEVITIGSLLLNKTIASSLDLSFNNPNIKRMENNLFSSKNQWYEYKDEEHTHQIIEECKKRDLVTFESSSDTIMYHLFGLESLDTSRKMTTDGIVKFDMVFMKEGKRTRKIAIQPTLDTWINFCNDHRIPLR